MYNKENKTANIIPGNSNGDKHLSYTTPSDTIITNKFGLAQMARPAAKALSSTNKNIKNRGILGRQTDEFMTKQSTAVLDKVSQMLKDLRDVGLLDQPQLHAKSGKDKTTKFANGFSNWWIDGLNAVSSLGKFVSDSVQDVKTSNSYAPNAFQNRALNKLYSLHIDPLQIIRNVRRQHRGNLYNINNLGGLSGSQKALSNVASGIGMYNSIANAWSDILKQNNAYLSDAAKQDIIAGERDRAAKMQSYQNDLDYYSKAHAAKLQMVNQDWANTMAALQLGYANQYKKYTFDNTMRLYDANWGK